MPTSSRPPPDAPLVGRAHELAAVEARLGSGGCLAACGPLGIGKTSVLAELQRRAEARGHLVLAGRGSEYERGVPYGVVLDALADYLDALPPHERARVAEGLAELAAVLPAAGGPPPPAAVEVERYRTHRALRTLLSRLARRSPLTLVLDDLHWADAETIELVAHLLRHPPGDRVLLAIAFRPAQAPEGLRVAVAQADGEGSCSELALEALTVEEADLLLGGAVPAAEREEIVRESGGNPFFLEQLARARTVRPVAEGAAGLRDAADVPPAVVAALQRELAALNPRARLVLEGGAIVGGRFDIDLAAAAAEMSEAAALPALDELLAAGLLRPTDAPRRFAFRHPLVRRAVYEAAGAGWRLAAHGRVAAALRAAGAPVTALADHVERSSTPADPEAAATLAAAAYAVATGAPATAARWFASSVRLLPAGAGERRLELRVSLAAALGGAGRLDDARRTLLDVLAESAPEHVQLRALAATFIARIDHALGRQGEARALLERTLAALDDPRSRPAAALELELAMDDHFSARHAPMRDRARHALDVARALDDSLLEAAALAALAHAEQNLGDIRASLASASRAAAILDGLDDAQCAPLVETFWWLASAEDVLERWGDCLGHVERGIRLARTFGVSFAFVALTHTLAVTLGWQGALVRAREAADATVEAAHLSGNDASITYAYTASCFVLTQAGEAHEAVRAGMRAIEAGRGLRQGLLVALPHANLGAALLAAGEPDRARAQLLEARARGVLDHWVGRCWWELWMCDTHLALGRLDEAEEWARAASRTAERMGLAGRLGAARRSRAAVALARGDAAGAAAGALAAAEALVDGGSPVGAARARIVAGRALTAAGRRDGAVAALERARAELIEAGAPRLADAAAHELRKLGMRVARSGRVGGAGAGIAALSARERQIAELVATGGTNREIAAQLHLAESTVENHLSRVYRKLDISSRAALAGAVTEAAGRPPGL